MSTKRRTGFRVAACLTGLVVGLAVAEAFVRLWSPYGHITPAALKTRWLQYEPSLFARHVFPQREQRAHRDWTDDVVYDVNRYGYRGPEFSLIKPPATQRVIIYGGSSVFDIEATVGFDWPRRVERLLRDRRLLVEVINAGIPGHATFDAVGRLLSEGHTLHPDVVVLYNAINDIHYFHSDVPILRQFRAYDDTWPVLNYRGAVDRFLSERSQLYVRLRMRYLNWSLTPVETHRIVDPFLRRQPERSDRLVDAAVEQYRLNVASFVDIARNSGAQPVLVTEARLATRDNPPEQRMRVNADSWGYSHDGLVAALERTDAVLREVAQAKRVTLVGAAASFNGRDDLFVDAVHLSRAGSEALATFVANQLELVMRPAASGAR